MSDDSHCVDNALWRTRKGCLERVVIHASLCLRVMELSPQSNASVASLARQASGLPGI